MPGVMQCWMVTSVNWKGHYKRLRLEPGPRYLDVPLSACVSDGDRVELSDDKVVVAAKHGTTIILPVYAVRETIPNG